MSRPGERLPELSGKRRAGRLEERLPEALGEPLAGLLGEWLAELLGEWLAELLVERPNLRRVGLARPRARRLPLRLGACPRLGGCASPPPAGCGEVEKGAASACEVDAGSGDGVVGTRAGAVGIGVGGLRRVGR